MCYDAGANQLVIPMNANNGLAFIPLKSAVTLPTECRALASRPIPTSASATRSPPVSPCEFDQGEPAAPFEVADQCQSKLRIVRQAHFVGGREQQVEPAAPLRLGQVPRQVPRDHVRVAAASGGCGRPAEDLADELGDSSG